MRDVLEELERWWHAGEPVGMATVTAVRGSAPLRPGSVLLAGPDGSVSGGVSGGCVEADVHALALEAAGGAPPRLVSYAPDPGGEGLFGIGLTCGGTVEILVERVDRATFPELPHLAAALRAGEPVALVTSVAPPGDGPSAGGSPQGFPARDGGTGGGTAGDPRGGGVPAGGTGGRSPGCGGMPAGGTAGGSPGSGGTAGGRRVGDGIAGASPAGDGTARGRTAGSRSTGGRRAPGQAEEPAPGRHLLVRPGRVAGTLGAPALDAEAARRARELLAAGRDGTFPLDGDAAPGPGGDGSSAPAGGAAARPESGGLPRHGDPADARPGGAPRLFVSVHPAPPRLIVVGAAGHAAALARLGVFLGHRVTVCDPRAAFATRRRFPGAHEVVTARPDRYLGEEAAAGRLDGRTAVCVLTHDPRTDVPALAVALRLELGHVGAMGSRRTHHDRLARLRAAGLTEHQLARLSSPLGLDLGALTPEETAVSVAAELIAHRTGATGARLATLTGSLHPPAAVAATPAPPAASAAPRTPVVRQPAAPPHRSTH
ncbi:XdhC/CoxI family protein [Streptomyces sp. PLAI1-29]|uniref:XdhC/CoxI family protein n=1 Tax=Streptomyces zingiberis TaxID=2053010 RepID=A0ABX1BUJ4_9ACTN|nr:XdhC/CoxI family protein [Streptomyces zingiberis]NJQ00215.1 XdhC/CoxI family protein [Streptomyces zingiberis]